MKTMMMSKFEDFFNDDPWELINEPCYPYGRRLYLNDERFWVSMNESGRILFFVHENGAKNVKEQVNLAGVDIKIDAHPNDEYRLSCILTATDGATRDKFSIVAKDVAHYCSKFDGPLLFVKVQERIKSWANFLKPKREGLSQSEFVGLWGELYSVSELLMESHRPADAVRFWVGPEDKKQDITLNSIAIEVKTSMSGDARTIKISSVDQLEKVTGALYLLHIIASPSDSGSGLSLEDLYLQCLQRVTHDDIAETMFLQKASELYGKANATQLTDKYSIVSLTLFDVNDDFPCITREDISYSIAKLNYEIYISTIKEFEVTEDILEVIENG